MMLFPRYDGAALIEQICGVENLTLVKSLSVESTSLPVHVLKSPKTTARSIFE